ncbi:3-phosphoinositide-dependent protein kinase 1 isoform X2 [Adelges cooleyi]|uniref:3-phosphoinositide-dependent protein kinase 1 isoform X2 n=1 Tax=Adelges cooleyi TaxID=133065 RepID=UPI00217FD8A8|nr:3-phosphoinositide-dependent protein kinase 1 isoform X2 [Adelges cooleyi]
MDTKYQKKQTSTTTVIVRSRPVQFAQTLARVFRIGRKEKISKKSVTKKAVAVAKTTTYPQHQPQQIVMSPPPPPTMQSGSPPPTQLSPPASNGQQTVVAANEHMIMPVTKRSPTDYIFGKVIGEGSYSTVYLAKDIHTNREHAIKVCEKHQIIREKKREQVRREKDALNILSNSGSSFFVKLYCTFQDAERLYFVMSYAKNGDMLPYINKVGSFDAACTRFYSGEILRALEHLHDLNIMHRDLKPENILLDHNMHIKVADFGCSKIVEQPDTADSDITSTESSVISDDEPRPRSNSFVGTAQYVSPELLTEKSISCSSDLWALGCIIYQMIAGLPPFRSRSEYMLFKKILSLDYEFPDGFNADAKDLVQKLLVLDPNERLGAKDDKRYTSIRSHHFYQDLDFDKLHEMNPPPIYPYLPGNSESQELRSQYRVPDHLEPGLDYRQLTRLLGLDGQSSSTTPAPAPRPRKRAGVLQMSEEEKQHQLQQQKCNNKWHNLVEGNLIVKQGLVDKRKGLFARRRMLCLTMGPHLYYADPTTMSLKGEIPWSPQLRVEPKNFRIFFVHTPNRTYYLEDPEGFALEWCKAIEEMRVLTYGVSTTTCA